MSKISSRLFTYTYTYVLCTRIRIYKCRHLVHPDSLGPPGFSRCLIPTPGLTSEYPTCVVCVCVRIHTHTPTYTSTHVKHGKDTDNTVIFPSIKNYPHTPSNKCPHRLVEPPHPHSPNAERSNCTCISAYAHPVASLLANVYADVHNTCLMYTPAHAWCPKHWSKCMHTLRKKIHMRSCMRAYATAQKLLCHETIANLS